MMRCVSKHDRCKVKDSYTNVRSGEGAAQRQPDPPRSAMGRNRPFERVAQIARCSGHQSSTQVIVGRGAHVGLAEAIPIVRDPAIYPFAESSRENTQKCGEPCYTAQALANPDDRFHAGPCLPIFDKEPSLRVHRVQSVVTHESIASFRLSGADAEGPGVIKLRNCARTPGAKSAVPVHDRYLTTVFEGRNGCILSIRVGCSLKKCRHSNLHSSFDPACVVS